MTRRKPADDRRGRNRGAPVAAALALAVVLLGVVSAGVYAVCARLGGLWREQCVVTDSEVDVAITTGRMVHPDVVTYHFGLTNGANLATIPFERLRTRLLARVPNIKDVRIERRQPNRVIVDVKEREPLVRIAPPQGRSTQATVADAEGMVFRCAQETASLPIVRESTASATPPGRRLDASCQAALRLVEEAAQLNRPELRILEIATDAPDHLLVTLGDYSRARVAWDHMLEDSRRARASLARQLRALASAIATHYTIGTTLWIATDWATPTHRIYAQDANRANP